MSDKSELTVISYMPQLSTLLLLLMNSSLSKANLIEVLVKALSELVVSAGLSLAGSGTRLSKELSSVFDPSICMQFIERLC
jgi:hypothetical protein